MEKTWATMPVVYDIIESTINKDIDIECAERYLGVDFTMDDRVKLSSAMGVYACDLAIEHMSNTYGPDESPTCPPPSEDLVWTTLEALHYVQRLDTPSGLPEVTEIIKTLFHDKTGLVLEDEMPCNWRMIQMFSMSRFMCFKGFEAYMALNGKQLMIANN